MIELARSASPEFPHAEVFLGDITDFGLGRPRALAQATRYGLDRCA
jgi:hypothetical protein